MREHAPRNGGQYNGICLFEDGQVDFTLMHKTIGNFKSLLGFVDAFPGWIEAYHTGTEKATEVAKLLLNNP